MNSGPDGTWFATTPTWWARLPMPVIGWKLWYADGSTVDSTQQTWAAAPAEGVQVLMVYHPRGYRTVVRGRDEYTHPMGHGGSKFGLEIGADAYHAILARAMADPWRC